ncbi:MAG: TRAP transporter fused permease subunit, partial [Alphaproteobacteria bacterium]
AAASAGGQVTPPIMGAAAFIMAEYQALPYSTIALAATVPALMHYLGVLVIVHFEAKRLGLSGERVEDIPRLGDVLRRGWPSAIPLGVLLYVLFTGYTPYMAAFCGITACIVIGLVNPMHRMTPRQLFDAFLEGGRSALAVGAICAAVGIVIAVITLTGLAFRMGFMVTSAAQDIARSLHVVLAFVPGDIFTLKELTRFLSMLFIGIACLLMGAGVPTTALYIMLVTVAQPAFTNLGIPPLATHLFVFYYGIISEVTPPVCTSAYAAAAIANSNPWKTGFAAFRLSNAKIMVPFVFCYSPAMLIVLPGTTWADFLQTTLTCAAGVFVLGMAFTGYVNRPISMGLRLLLGFAGLMLGVRGTYTDLLAVAIVVPVLGWLLLSGRKGAAAREDFTAAIERIVAGLEKRNRILNPAERRVVAHHEMGHAIVAMSLPGCDPVHKVSIIPRGVGALGYTIQRPTEDRFLMSRPELEAKMAMLLGGRAAEILALGEPSTGAADDLARATDIARAKVARYGMDAALGHVRYEDEGPRLLPMPGLASTARRDYGEATAREIDEAVRRLVEAAFARATATLVERRAALDRGAAQLLERETLAGPELAALLAA